MKFAIRRIEPNGYARFICPNCGNTLFISDETADIDPPRTCGHCGKEVYFYGNDFEGGSHNENN